MEATHAIVLGASLTLCIVLVVFILARYNYLIKKAMIDREGAVDMTAHRFRYLEYGCILMGIGAGLGLSSVFTAMNLSEDTTDLLVWATILVCGGVGLLVAHSIRRKQESDI